jgi:hypothetical protein
MDLDWYADWAFRLLPVAVVAIVLVAAATKFSGRR